MKCIGVLLILAACKGGSSPNPVTDPTEVHTSMAVDDDPPPPYDKAALQMALIAERAAEAKGEAAVSEAEKDGDLDRLQVVAANLAVRRRFIAILEVCQAETKLCPPRLDEPGFPLAVESEEDPKLDVPLRFDLASWQKVTNELHGRACACRTLQCIDAMDASLGRLEKRPIEEVQADDAALTSLTRARECLFRLRGKRAIPRVVADN